MHWTLIPWGAMRTYLPTNLEHLPGREEAPNFSEPELERTPGPQSPSPEVPTKSRSWECPVQPCDLRQGPVSLLALVTKGLEKGIAMVP